MNAKPLLPCLLVLPLFAATNAFAADPAAPDDGAKTIFQRAFGEGASKKWADYLADTAEASVSAAGMLGISGDAITNVQNVKDVNMVIKGLGSKDAKTAVGISITPARTSLFPMDLHSYAEGGLAMQLAGSLTLGYAQGNSAISGKDYERRAFSIESSAYLRPEDDPVIAYARAFRSKECDVLQASAPSEPTATSSKVDNSSAARKPGEVPADEYVKRATSCREKTIKALRWNRSQVSASFAAGRIKSSDGALAETSLGRMAVIGMTYGFRDSALSVVVRRTWDEPVLSTLGAAQVNRKNSSLGTVRLASGSNDFRGLIEYSSSQQRDITASQRTFKYALGLDLNLKEAIAKGTWLNIRLGQQRKIDGQGNEIGSLLSISYSPSALLKM